MYVEYLGKNIFTKLHVENKMTCSIIGPKSKVCFRYLLITTCFGLIFMTFVLYIGTNHTNILQFQLQISDNDSAIFYERTYDGNKYVGKAFDKISIGYLRPLGLYNVGDVDDDKVLASTPTFVTAFSDNHFTEGSSMLKHLEAQNQNKKTIYVYDIGLSKSNRRKLLKQFDSIIIELRTFPFHQYPEYVRNLNSYRWKPLIIAQMLVEHPSVWWLDASAKMVGPIKTVYSEFNNCSTEDLSSCPHYPWVLVDMTGHSIFATTEPKMFDYLPIPTQLAKETPMHGANLQLIYGIKSAKENILRYWVLCALEKDCMHPYGAYLYCSFSKDHYNDYAKCHRFDQSAVNILLAWENNFNASRYQHNVDNSFKIERF